MRTIALPQPPDGMPLRRLSGQDRPGIEKHLLDLDLVSRNRRFHGAFGETAVAAYVLNLDLNTGVVVGAFESDSGRIVGLGEAHPADLPRTVEVGASVLTTHRRRGLGHGLVAHAVALAFEQGAVAAQLLFDPTDPAVTRIVAKLRAQSCAPGHAVLRLAASGNHPTNAASTRL